MSARSLTRGQCLTIRREWSGYVVFDRGSALRAAREPESPLISPNHASRPLGHLSPSFRTGRTARKPARLRRLRLALHCPAMIKPRVDKLMDRADSHYTAVVDCREAGPAAEQLLPRARRGHVRGAHAADGRDRQRQLPHDRSRGARGRQDQLRVPALTPARSAPWRASPYGGSRGKNPDRRQRRHRRLQGGRAGASRDARPATASG